MPSGLKVACSIPCHSAKFHSKIIPYPPSPLIPTEWGKGEKIILG
jgi:hypothetical protein